MPFFFVFARAPVWGEIRLKPQQVALVQDKAFANKGGLTAPELVKNLHKCFIAPLEWPSQGDGLYLFLFIQPVL